MAVIFILLSIAAAWSLLAHVALLVVNYRSFGSNDPQPPYLSLIAFVLAVGFIGLLWRI